MPNQTPPTHDVAESQMNCLRLLNALVTTDKETLKKIPYDITGMAFDEMYYMALNGVSSYLLETPAQPAKNILCTAFAETYGDVTTALGREMQGLDHQKIEIIQERHEQMKHVLETILEKTNGGFGGLTTAQHETLYNAVKKNARQSLPH